MARIQVRVHPGMRTKYQAWCASLPGNEADKIDLLRGVYLPELAKRAKSHRKAGIAGGLWIPGPANSKFFVSVSRARPGVIEITILDIILPNQTPQ